MTTRLYGQEQNSLGDIHSAVSENLVSLAQTIDTFFFNVKDIETHNQTNLRFYQVFSKSESQDFEKEFYFRINLDLPNIEKKFRFSLERRSEANIDTSAVSKESLTTEVDRPTEVRGGFSYLFDKIFDFDMKLSTGVKVSIPPTPFAEFKLSRDVLFLGGKFRFYANTFWSHRDGVGQSSSIDYDYKLFEKMLLRFANEASWTDMTDRIFVSHGPTLFHTISDRRIMAYSARANFVNKPNYALQNYDLSIHYRQTVVQKILFYEVVPRLTFPRSNRFSKVYSGLIKFELVF